MELQHRCHSYRPNYTVAKAQDATPDLQQFHPAPQSSGRPTPTPPPFLAYPNQPSQTKGTIEANSSFDNSLRVEHVYTKMDQLCHENGTSCMPLLPHHRTFGQFPVCFSASSHELRDFLFGRHHSSASLNFPLKLLHLACPYPLKKTELCQLV